MFSRIFTVMSVQPIETRKIVALMAVIERMNTTPRPAKNAGSDQRQRDAAERRRAARAQPLRGLLEALVDLLQQRDGRPDARRAVAEDVAGDDDERGRRSARAAGR